ncbi:hypothetical protein J4471_01240 [Candidatus Woesearchaeota archaeon]|nr:hypothetical protein [Candidatus Woesearchaeota archaeon]
MPIDDLLANLDVDKVRLKIKKNKWKSIECDIEDAENYILLEGKKYGNYSYPDMLISTRLKYFGQNWVDAHKKLRQENSFMLTIRQFADFLKLLKLGIAYNGLGNKLGGYDLDRIQDEVLMPEQREWLDASFTITRSKVFYMAFNNKIGPKDNPIPTYDQRLGENILRHQRSIDFDKWLNTKNKLGLPIKKQKGDLYFNRPSNNSVTYFGVFQYAVPRKPSNPIGYVLGNCDMSFSYPNLGVRSAKNIQWQYSL